MQDEFMAFKGRLKIRTFRDGKLVREFGPFHNKVVSSNGYGRNLIMRALAGDPTYPIEIDSAAVGDGTAAPSDGDTALGNSLVSGITVSNSSIANNILTLEFFVPDGSLANDTYEEFGLFANLRLFSRLLISPSFTKSTGEDTLFTYELEASG